MARTGINSCGRVQLKRIVEHHPSGVNRVAAHQRSCRARRPQQGHAGRVDAVAAEHPRDTAALLCGVDQIDTSGVENILTTLLGAGYHIVCVGGARERCAALKGMGCNARVPAAGDVVLDRGDDRRHIMVLLQVVKDAYEGSEGGCGIDQRLEGRGKLEARCHGRRRHV